ncbi:IS3 family transposase [Streptococcus thermophilus]|nr:IS3 family transposase [Streptococcus thermophilus]
MGLLFFDIQSDENFSIKVFKISKAKCLSSDVFDELEQAITDYLFYYNNKRIKAKLKGLSPVQYRTKSFQ